MRGTIHHIKSTFTGLLFLLCLQCLAQTPEEKLKALNIVKKLVTRTGNKIPQIAMGTYQIHG